MKIQKIFAEEILDSRGNPTIVTTVTLEDGSVGSASVPSGASTGEHEAYELRDQDNKRYKGMGVLKAIGHVNEEIASLLLGQDAEDQEKIDRLMCDLDGTVNKSNLGANAILSVSLAAAKSEAKYQKKELYEYLSKFNPKFDKTYLMPLPQLNIINGAKHANWATDIQEYMIFPIGATSVEEALRMGSEVYHSLQELLKEKNYSIMVGDEGGFAPSVNSNEEPLILMSEAVEKAGYTLGIDIAFGIDGAASEFYQQTRLDSAKRDGKYHLSKDNKDLTGDELSEMYISLQSKYPIVSYEDIFDQNDFSAFSKITQKIGGATQIVGDDLYATHPERLKRGIEESATNAILVKLNQIGTLSETVVVMEQAREANMNIVISHRSGETTDTFIADLSVAMGNGQIKAGAPNRGERVAKYNRLMQIERQLGEKAKLAAFPFKPS